MFENKQSVSIKSRRRFLHLSSFSDSNSFMIFKSNVKPKQTNKQVHDSGPLTRQDLGTRGVDVDVATEKNSDLITVHSRDQGFGQLK